MSVFNREELEAFLIALDRNLPRPFDLEIIGEAVAILTLGAQSGTEDIDAVTNTAPIQPALDAARKETGLDIPLTTVGIYDVPYYYEKRLKQVRIPGLSKLRVYVPEKHDWALTKIMRALRKDVEDIEEVADSVGLSKTVFLKRFIGEMTHVTGRREDLIYNFLGVMARLFGEKEAGKMDRAIQKSKSWQ